MKKRWLAVGLLGYTVLFMLLGAWFNQPVAWSKPPVDIIRMTPSKELAILVPDLGIGTTFEMSSTIERADGQLIVDSPRITLAKGSGIRYVRIPAGLQSGYYTVNVNVAYLMNPLRYIHQSSVIAVLVVEES